MEVSRTTHALTFNTGVSNAEWASGIVGQTPGQTQQALLPGSTTVTAALDEVFPEARTAANDIFAALVAGAGPALRTASGFNLAARKALRSLRGRKGPAAQRAARELGALLADTELFESYRAALLET